jgi:hypothetical protein
MSRFSEETQKILEMLREVAAETLERKRRLGHYAVVWQDGKPVAIGEDAPEHLAAPEYRENNIAIAKIEESWNQIGNIHD